LVPGAAVLGKVGMVCLRFGESGNTKGPFCPHAHNAPDNRIISTASTKPFIKSSITGRHAPAGTSPGGNES
jgi:hypothetical protein